uniref:Uncharacterized protein n=1 Tax=Tanacetum cinerariifolium TaxID=118510 RepID=A0A699GIJ7_TANCI|nr:hypothetical protein [Tanacetum cinerariifolium]
MQKRKNDVMARTTLLLALPDEHQLRFSKYDTAKELYEAILKTFGGNKATKKIKKNQLKQQYGNFKAQGSETLEQTFNRLYAIVSHLEFMDVPIEQDDLNQKFLTRLAPEWLVYTIVWRNRDDLDTMSLDDVYNHLKVYEPEVQKRARSKLQNMAFISSSNTSSGKSEVPTVQGVSTASAQVSTDSTNNLALLSMKADRFWKKTGKKITIQGSDVDGFEKSKVECFNCHKMVHFAIECRSPKSQDRGKRESYKKDPKVEEHAPKAMIAIDGIGWDWSYMAEEDEASKNHALVADEEEVKKEKESIDFKIENFKNASKDLDRLLGSQKLDKDKKGVGFNEYCVVPPPPAQVYSPPKKDLSWMGLPEFVDDTLTDYTRPTPSIDVSKSVSKELKERWKNNNPSFFKQRGSSGNVVSKPMIKFVKEYGCSNATKVNNTENARKPTVKYAKMYRNTSQSPGVSGNQRNWNNQKSQQLGKDFMMQNKACYNCGPLKEAAKNKVWVLTVRPKIPTVGSKVLAAKPTIVADKGNKGKAVKASARWIWKPKQNSSCQGSNFNGVSVTLKKYQYIGTQGRLKHMTGNISYLFLSMSLLIEDMCHLVMEKERLLGGDSRNSANGLNMDPVVNMCLNFLHGSDSK